jgi:hypothetical protein
MNRLNIGWASRDVSSKEPLDIPGQFYMRVSTGVLDPLTVTALVVDNGEDLVCFLSCDFVAIRGCLVRAVRDKVARLIPGFPVEKIILNATHTHAGASYYESTPVSMAIPAQVPHPGVEIASSDDYREFLVSQAADAVREAYERRAPGGIAFGYGYAVVSHSRRTVYSDDVSQRPGAVSRSGMMVDGHARMYGQTDDERFSHYEAGADHFINLLYTFDAGNRLSGAIVNIPCPSQCSEHRRQLSADFWDDFRSAIRKTHGNIFLLPQCAAAGDLSPRILHYHKAQQRRFRLKYGNDAAKDLAERKDIAERVACAFGEVLDWAQKDIQTTLPVSHVVKTAWLTRRLVSDEEAAQEAQQLAELNKAGFTQDGPPLECLDRNSTLVARRNRCQRILLRHAAQKTEPRLPMELHVLRIGDVAFATNSFELYMDYMHRIQARSPFSQTFIVQLVGNPADTGGYLCTERGAWGRGYSASLYCNQVSPQGGQELVDETVTTLKAIYVGSQKSG